MAPYQSPRRLGDVLGDVIKELGIERRLDEARVVEAWAELAGAHINARCESVWVNRGKLYVKIGSAAWRQELHLQRRDWCRRLNERLGADLVEEIVFR
jgi:predicted nucleic acid-binding Zn ribbon protein